MRPLGVVCVFLVVSTSALAQMQSRSTLTWRPPILPLGAESTVIDVTTFGATGNGATDDTVAIEAAIAALTKKGGGTLFFPAGTYYTGTCGFTISVPTKLEGVGQLAVDSTQRGSLIQCGSPTANLFNVTTDLFTVRDIAFTNTMASTAGAAIFMNGATVHSRINAQDFSINGFYDAIDINAAAYWDISQFHITNPARYGISVQNVLNNDEGDWQIHDGSCVGGWQTSVSTTPGSSACIAVFTSGGGKIHTIKSNATYTHGIYINVVYRSSSQTLMINLDIENTTNSPIYIAQGWSYMMITDSYLNAPVNYPAIYGYGIGGYYFGENLLETGNTNPSAAMVLENVAKGVIGPNSINGFFASATSVACASTCTDLSSLVYGANPIYRCTTAGALPVGALTTNPSACGAATFTGIRTN